MDGGTFNGGTSRDLVLRMRGGTFHADDGDDGVGWMYAGAFHGGDGSDRISFCVDSPPATYDSVESVASVSVSTIPLVVTENPCSEPEQALEAVGLTRHSPMTSPSSATLTR